MIVLMWILIALIVAIGCIFAYASTRPDKFETARSITIRARPEDVFPRIASLRRMDEWNPFVKADPAIKIDYTDPDTGAGARSTFAGNNLVGAGSVTIVDSIAPQKVVSRLLMTRPMKADNIVEFTLKPVGDGTNVTWTMRGVQPLMAKVMTLFIDCDKMVGGQFEKGLSDLKALAER